MNDTVQEMFPLIVKRIGYTLYHKYAEENSQCWELYCLAHW